MNALPDKPFAPDPKAGKRRGAAAEPDGVRLTMDFEDEGEGEDQGRAPGPGWADGEVADPATDRMIGVIGDKVEAGSAAGTAARPSERDSRPEANPGATAPPGARRKAAPAMPAQLAGIEVTLSVEVGTHRLPLRDLMAVDPGQIFPLDRMTSEPVSILVNGRPFARGEVVAIGDRFGVRLLDILSAEAGE
jgi:flagellar motor switch protein FliN/FliY